MKMWRMPVRACPTCGADLVGAHHHQSERPPAPGDLTICLACAAGLRFTDDGLEALTPADLAALPADARREFMGAMYQVKMAADSSTMMTCAWCGRTVVVLIAQSKIATLDALHKLGWSVIDDADPPTYLCRTCSAPTERAS